MTKFVDI